VLLPKRLKYRRHRRGRLKGKSKAARLVFGDAGLKAVQAGWVSARQIEAARRALTRFVRRIGKLWIRIFPDKPVTQRAPESRMGAGKGSVEYWVAVVKPETVLFEIIGLDSSTAQRSLYIASTKLPIRTAFLKSDQK